MREGIYLDFNATTPPTEEVMGAVERAMRDSWGNPSSSHEAGTRARHIVEASRQEVARLLRCDPSEIVFTSGGTESDNAAVLGTALALRDRGRHLITSAVEHPAVEEACQRLIALGFSVTRVPVRRDGAVDPGDIAAALRPDTILVSLIHANNETGVIQPVGAVARIARARNVVVHTDAAQSVGKISVHPRELGADLLTIAGHKLHAPKGVGALYVRAGTAIEPFLCGGGQERGLRPGTENVSGIAGLGAACSLALREASAREARMRSTRDRLERRLVERFPRAIVHGREADRLPNTLSIALPGIPASRLLRHLDGVAISTGAACHSGDDEPSRVLTSMGIDTEIALATLRVSTGRDTTDDQIDQAFDRIAAAAQRVAHEPGRES